MPPGAQHMTLAEFVGSVLNKPVIGDRLRLGDAELVVRKMEGVAILELGLRLPH